MENLDEIHGAYSKIFIEYEGSLQDLGGKIEIGLDIPAFRFENMEEEPYDLVGYVETFGFEVELKRLRQQDYNYNCQYVLYTFTTDSFQETFYNRMFDISLWMARYISLICKLTTMVEHSDKRKVQSFYLNPITGKRESKFIDVSM